MKRVYAEEEKGAVMVIVAIALSVLLGMTALAFDFGLLASTKQSLQNAVDAAALAGARDLGDGKSSTTVHDTLCDYCAVNGYTLREDGVSGTMKINGKQVTVTLEKEVPMGFSTVLTGQKTRKVSAVATAEAISIFGDCPYALFAGQRIEDDGTGIAITGNDITINGNIHSNSDIIMRNAVLGNGAIATAVRNVVPSSTGWNGNSIALDMPSFRSFESGLKGITPMVEFGGNVTKNSKAGFAELINEALARYREQAGNNNSYLYKGLYIHISGNLTFNGHNSTVYNPSFPIVLIVDGDIDLNGAPITSTKDYPVAIMSKNGNITVNGGGATYTGILYAPQGDITLNGNDARFVGMIVGQNIRKTGGKIIVTYFDDADRYIPTTKVHLIA